METISTNYICSACGETGPVIGSEGSQASDHMRDVHGIDSSVAPEAHLDPDAPYLIPLDSNPRL